MEHAFVIQNLLDLQVYVENVLNIRYIKMKNVFVTLTISGIKILLAAIFNADKIKSLLIINLVFVLMDSLDSSKIVEHAQNTQL